MSNPRILIVEDERLLRMSLSAELSANGYAVEQADTAKAGVARRYFARKGGNAEDRP